MILNHVPPIGNAAASNLLSGLVSCWELDETSGSTAYDAAGNHNGTYNNLAINQTGLLGKSVQYSATSGEGINLGNLGMSGGQVFYSAWVNLTTGMNINNLFSQGYAAWGENFFRIFNMQIHVGTYYSGQNYLANAAIQSGEIGVWTHIAAGYDGTHWSIWVNGVRRGYAEKTMGLLASTDNWYFGCRSLIDRTISGLVDQIAIWNRALNYLEISKLFNNGNGLAYSNW